MLDAILTEIEKTVLSTVDLFSILYLNIVGRPA